MLWMRHPEVAEAADVKNRHIRLDRRLGIRRIKRAGFRRMLVGAQRYLEGAFNIGD